jgi:hypothetical protein
MRPMTEKSSYVIALVLSLVSLIGLMPSLLASRAAAQTLLLLPAASTLASCSTAPIKSLVAIQNG